MDTAWRKETEFLGETRFLMHAGNDVSLSIKRGLSYG
jgi:hypothetical protein